MGFFSNLEIEVLDLHASGVSMVNIATQTGLSLQQVMDVIDNDPDFGMPDIVDPAEYAEMSADADAEYFGQVF
jgi:hypothetical protein